METSTKNALITGAFSIITALIGTISFSFGKEVQNNRVEKIINQRGIITVNENEETADSLNRLLDEYIALKNDFNIVSNEYFDLLEKVNNFEGEKSIVLNDNTTTDNLNKINNSSIYLNELPIFNCQYYYDGTWRPEELYEWTITDKAADGNTYKNATWMSIGGHAGFAQTFIVDYLLNYKYKVFNGNFMLDEISKSTTTIATLNIYGDENLLYTFDNITGGIIPQNTGDISIQNVNKLRFEFISKQGELGNWNEHFGIVFYDSILR